jgi:hypothetical protein
MPKDVVVIRLNVPMQECAQCGTVCESRQGLPMANGEIVENNYQGEWGGSPACPPCYQAHAEGGVAGLKHRLIALREASRNA